MYECRHFFEDDCEQLPASLGTGDELLVNANGVYSNILSIRFLEHVGSPLDTRSFLDEKIIKVATSRTTARDAPSYDEDWMEGLSVADVLRQCGVDPNAVLSSDGVLRAPEGLEYDDESSGSSEPLPPDSSSSSASYRTSTSLTETISRTSDQTSRTTSMLNARRR